MSQIVIEGIYRDRLWGPDGKLIFDSQWKSNMIVMQGRRLLAGFMKNEGTAHGIQSLKIGRGDAAWDTIPPPQPDPNTLDRLVDNTPFVISGGSLLLQYLLPDEVPTLTPTNRLQIVAVLGPNQPTPAADPPYPMREFGLFGQMNGTDFMIDYIRHPLIEKDGLVTMERKVRLIF
ncbi:MAG: hypothetical protein WCD76_08795 [Pyrinomonadaceae bacterium]